MQTEDPHHLRDAPLYIPVHKEIQNHSHPKEDAFIYSNYSLFKKVSMPNRVVSSKVMMRQLFASKYTKTKCKVGRTESYLLHMIHDGHTSCARVQETRPIELSKFCQEHLSPHAHCASQSAQPISEVYTASTIRIRSHNLEKCWKTEKNHC
jgi:hypothetical protein